MYRNVVFVFFKNRKEIIVTVLKNFPRNHGFRTRNKDKRCREKHNIAAVVGSFSALAQV